MNITRSLSQKRLDKACPTARQVVQKLFTIAAVLIAVNAKAEDKITLPLLVNKAGDVLLSNATFSSVINRRATFRNAEGVPKAFNVDDISETNLQALKINLGEVPKAKEPAKTKPLIINVGLPRKVVVSDFSMLGGFEKCSATIEEEGYKEILIHFPPALKSLITAYEKKSKEAIAQGEYAERLADEAEKADAVAPTYAGGNAAYVDAAMKQRDKANLMVLNAKKEAGRFTKLSSEATALKNAIIKQMVFTARSTGTKYGNNEIWEYVGPAK